MLLSVLLPACGLASTQQQPVPVPVAVLTLAGQQAAADIAAHLVATAAAAWEPDLAAWVAAAAPLEQALAADGGGGALVAVASVAEAPDESLAATLAFLAERAPIMEQVRKCARCVCGCGLALGLVELRCRAGGGAGARRGCWWCRWSPHGTWWCGCTTWLVEVPCAGRAGDRPCGNAA